MTHGNYYGDHAPAIIDRLFGEDYEGPLPFDAAGVIYNSSITAFVVFLGMVASVREFNIRWAVIPLDTVSVVYDTATKYIMRICSTGYCKQLMDPNATSRVFPTLIPFAINPQGNSGVLAPVHSASAVYTGVIHPTANRLTRHVNRFANRLERHSFAMVQMIQPRRRDTVSHTSGTSGKPINLPVVL